MRILMFIVTILACLISLLMLATACKAQNIDSIRHIIFKTKITGTDGITTSGYLHSVSDTGLSIMRTENHAYSAIDRGYLTNLNPERINSVSIRRKNQIGRGLAIGALTGAALGIITGVVGSSGESEEGFHFGAGAYALGGMIGGAAIGGVLGVAFSLSSKRYKVNGQESKYVRMQNKINTRLTKKKRVA